MGRSRGTLPFQLAGNIKRRGLVEKAFGVTLRELLYDYGGGSLSGRPMRAVQVGGPLGTYLPESQWDTIVDYEAFAAVGAMLGHGGIVVRRHRRHARTGEVCDGILCDRILRQMHAVPDRFDARRGSHRSHPRRHRPRQESRADRAISATRCVTVRCARWAG